MRSRSLATSGMMIMALACVSGEARAQDAEGFVSIFNGRTLEGWEGDPAYWRVEDASIVGEITPETVLRRNTFLIWRGGVLEDFELKVEYRITDRGNSGISYRNEQLPDAPFSLTGYQADLDGGKRYVGSLYEERGRTTLASQGTRVTIPDVELTDSLRAHVQSNAWIHAVVDAQLGDPDSLDAVIRTGDWNEYHIIARGNRLQHYVNGVLMSDVTDNDTSHRRLRGLLGVQVHTGPPMKVEYRNFRLKPL